MKTLKNTVLCLCLLVAGAALFTGCQTAEGFGEDMENAGEALQDQVN
ncbi:MAG TPA: entericidin A/B family lipoprotein [Verrucomicrobia bacterium]|nr:entericidin A/B family lipoprotein [Verrucomicrobiota bacterium]HOB31613.1 entericidin A/B family lipoprotein [Verrucomicrobiota bacterium]HOP96537.1 entericidin A/B family lipoprotein [Verrucomicrobiota bacterium]HPU56844.1 entericidin A/B family lipoprotein [Verrucomicrobiota bacterium]